ncbi:MAG TPA: non-heme iron oxygenase ferredoxin subunit [Chloroflexota bacterium]|jgi:3-phenylpropionate/trans-cinnamate dioxygenase ferredoxin subunit|nr:non-heme iron oxygenase ferredoxin subunit [Chloroflexota bacterium]
MPEFVPAAKVDELPDESGKCVTINGKKIALFHVGDDFYAVDDTCTHEEASLSEGTLYLDDEEPQVECPKHGAIFEISTGQVLTLPAVKSVRSYETKVEGDSVLVSTEPKA